MQTRLWRIFYGFLSTWISTISLVYTVEKIDGNVHVTEKTIMAFGRVFIDLLHATIRLRRTTVVLYEWKIRSLCGIRLVEPKFRRVFGTRFWWSTKSSVSDPERLGEDGIETEYGTCRKKTFYSEEARLLVHPRSGCSWNMSWNELLVLRHKPSCIGMNIVVMFREQ